MTGRSFRDLARRHGPILLVLALAAALRLPALGRDGLWGDEAFTAFWSRLPLGDLIRQLQADCHAPLSYLLARAVRLAAGAGEWAIRLPSALLGVLSVGLVFSAGRRFASRKAGLAAAFLLAVSPIHVHYSREARPYSLLIFLALLSLLLAAELTRRQRWPIAAASAICLAALLYTHNVGLFFAAGLLAAFTWHAHRSRESLRPWLLLACLTGLLYLPWLGVTLLQAGQADVVFGWARAAWERRFPWQPLLSAATLSHGAPVPVRNEAREFPLVAWAALALTLPLIIRAVSKGGWKVERAGGALLLTVAATLGGLFAYSAVGTPIYVVGRVDVIVVPALMILMGAALASFRPGVAIPAGAVLALMAAPALWTSLTADFRSQEKSIAAFLASSMDRHDALVVTGPFLASQQHYIGLSRPDVGIRAFPPEREAHPGWVDWASLGQERLSGEAVDLIEELRGRDPSPGSIWVLLHPRNGNEAVISALEELAPRLEALETGYLGLRIVRARQPGSTGTDTVEAPAGAEGEPSAGEANQ